MTANRKSPQTRIRTGESAAKIPKKPAKSTQPPAKILKKSAKGIKLSPGRVKPGCRVKYFYSVC